MAVRDVLLIGVLVFTIAIGLLIIKFSVNTTLNTMITNPIINQSNQTVESFLGVNRATERFDYVILVIFIGLILALLITSWFIAGNPIFTFIYIIVLILGVAFSSVLTTVWEDVKESVLSSQMSSFPIADSIIMRLPLYISIIGFIGLVIMFAKPYFQGE